MKRHTIFKILLIIYILAVTYLCLASSVNMPQIPKTILGIRGDKFVHFIMFFPFVPLAFLARKDIPSGWLEKSIIIVELFLIGCGFGGLTEMVQGYTPTREPDWMDLRADVYSLFCSSVILWLTALNVNDKKKKR